jgi:hypothetical protein
MNETSKKQGLSFTRLDMIFNPGEHPPINSRSHVRGALGRQELADSKADQQGPGTKPAFFSRSRPELTSIMLSTTKFCPLPLATKGKREIMSSKTMCAVGIGRHLDARLHPERAHGTIVVAR